MVGWGIYSFLGYDSCFQDFIDRVHDVQTVRQSLNREILEFEPPCKVTEYPLVITDTNWKPAKFQKNGAPDLQKRLT